MNEKQFMGYWFTGAGLVAAVVAVAAGLLLAIIATARSILGNATRALGLAKEIVENTRPIWELEHTNAAAVQLVEGARAIERHATQVADALDGGQASS